ncbi:MAG: methyltransferase family protein [Promethearchaeota archaeon]
MKRKESKGESAWRECFVFRAIASIFMFIITINMILWIWFPIQGIDWKVHENMWLGIGIGIAITIPGIILMMKGEMDAGKETLKPSAETKLYGGIYNYIRHPQSLGEFPLFIAIGFFVNSWFLIILSGIFIIIYVPIMIHYEEQDLIKRFGESYIQYKDRTGALFPKIRK